VRSGPSRTLLLAIALASLATLASPVASAWAQCTAGSLFSVGGAYSAGPRPRSVVAADFNGDGVRDLGVSNSAVDANTVTIMLGNGDGTYHSGGSFDAGGPALGLATPDLNSDGIRDLAVANGDYGTVSILLGQGSGGAGDGTFAAPVGYAALTTPELLAAGDFNSDGIHDLAVVDRAARQLQILLGQGSGGVGDGTVAPGFFLFMANAPSSLMTTDVNTDNITDLVMATTLLGRLSVLIGKGANGIGDGTFIPPVNYAAGPSPSDVALHDFNGDGRLDAAVANRSSGGVSILLGLGNGTFGAAAAFGAGNSLSAVAALDVDNDAIVDVLATTSPGDRLVFLKGGGTGGKGDGTFAAPVIEAAVGTSPSDVVVTRLNGDCAADVAVVSQNDVVTPPYNLSILLGQCAHSPCFVAPDPVDNVAPPPPTSFVATLDPGGIRLTWNVSIASDVVEYRVHRGSIPSFVPLPGNLAATVPGTSCLDPAGTIATIYKIVAVDIHGNAGPPGSMTAQPICPPPSGGYVANLFGTVVSTRQLSAAQYDTTFGGFRSAYDLSQGWAIAKVTGEAGYYITTSTTERYWIVGGTAGQPVTFSASLQIEAQTSQTCGVHCATGYVSGSLFEPGVSSPACPPGSGPCVTLTHLPYEPFTLTVEAQAGVGGVIFGASAYIKATLKFAGLPGGAFVRSCSGYMSDIATPVLLSLVRSAVENGVARLTWYSPDNSVPSATVYRAAATGEWSPIGETIADGSGYLVFEDASVLPGARYGYRVGVFEDGAERMFGETWLDVPALARLALDNVAPNPAAGAITIGFSLASSRPAPLELFDVSGRRVQRRDVGPMGAGHHSIALDEGGTLPPGIYLLRLSQGSAFASKRIVKTR
jgi:hypothetical protein